MPRSLTLPVPYHLTPFNFLQRVTGALCLALLRLGKPGSGIQNISNQTIRTNLGREKDESVNRSRKTGTEHLVRQYPSRADRFRRSGPEDRRAAHGRDLDS